VVVRWTGLLLLNIGHS